MRRKRCLQEPAVTAHVSKPGKEFSIASSLVGAVQEPLHCIERSALVDLKIRIEIVRQCQIGIQPQGRLKGFIGCAQPLDGTLVVLVPKPAGAAKSRPCWRIQTAESQSTPIQLNPARYTFPFS